MPAADARGFPPPATLVRLASGPGRLLDTDNVTCTDDTLEGRPVWSLLESGTGTRVMIAADGTYELLRYVKPKVASIMFKHWNLVPPYPAPATDRVRAA